MRKELMMMGLVGILGCTEKKYDVSRVGKTIEIAKPEACEIVKDIRLEHTFGYYQLKCADKDENIILYERGLYDDSWTKITVK